MSSPATIVEAVSGERAAELNPPLEVGLVLVGHFDPIDAEAMEVARRQLRDELQDVLPDFAWRLTLVHREELTTPQRDEPMSLFPQGQVERDLHKWDFVFVITSADLIGYYKPFTLAAVSRTLDMGVLSTARIDPRAVDMSAAREIRVERIAQRMKVLLLRCLGHLNGLELAEDPSNYMWDADDVAELDAMRNWTNDQLARLRTNLLEIADLRMEEEGDVPRSSEVLFLLQAGWLQRREIVAGVLQAAPWEFPVRLSRLTTTAFSAMLVLLMTAETWDMAMSQSFVSVGILICVVLLATTAYVVKRQQLLVRRQDRILTEQIAVSNLTSSLTVLCGMITSLCVLIAISLSLSLLLFSRQLVVGWAASLDGSLALRHYFLLSGVVSALSIAIGALGAAFEDQSYFRHVTFVDEEL